MNETEKLRLFAAMLQAAIDDKNKDACLRYITACGNELNKLVAIVQEMKK